MSKGRALFAELLRSAQKLGHSVEPHIDTKPVPASRPRVTRWGTYYTKTYKNWRDDARRLLQEAVTGPDPLTGPLVVFTEIVSPKAKTSKRHWPQGDNDNFEKAAWDALTSDGRFWLDDDQIVLNITFKRYADQHETVGTRITIFQLGEG